METVIGAFELQNHVAASCSPRETNRMHGDFGTTVAEAAHLHGKASADFFGEFPLHVMRHAIHRAGGKTFLNRFHHGGEAMACHERTEGQVVVKVFIAVEIAELAAARVFYEDRIGIISTVVAGDAERNAL